MEPADKSHEIMSPPGLIGNEALDHEALNCRGPVLLDKVEEMPEVPPPPGLGDKVDEVLQGNSISLPPKPGLANNGPIPVMDEGLIGCRGGICTATAMPHGDWKQFIPPGFGNSQQWCSWKEGEPALVQQSSSLDAAHGGEAQSHPAYINGKEDDVAQTAATEHLSSENARLAMENEMLRRENMQLTLGAAASASEAMQAAYWSEVYHSGGMEMPMPYAPPFFPPWCMGASMPGQAPGSLAWPWGRKQSIPARATQMNGNSKPRATRARTDSDLPARAAATNETAPRSRTLSEENLQEEAESDPAESGPKTTVMLRNVPNNYSRTMLLNLINTEGFAGEYDFVYLPMDFKSHASLGYAFVNLVTPEKAAAFWTAFDGFNKWKVASQKVCSVSWSCPYQGLEAHIERYRNSPIMHSDMPDEYKPIVFRNDQRVPFPAPTKKLKAPRMRLCTHDGTSSITEDKEMTCQEKPAAGEAGP